MERKVNTSPADVATRLFGKHFCQRGHREWGRRYLPREPPPANLPPADYQTYTSDLYIETTTRARCLSLRFPTNLKLPHCEMQPFIPLTHACRRVFPHDLPRRVFEVLLPAFRTHHPTSALRSLRPLSSPPPFPRKGPTFLCEPNVTRGNISSAPPTNPYDLPRPPSAFPTSLSHLETPRPCLSRRSPLLPPRPLTNKHTRQRRPAPCPS